ncbi:MAG: response regulator [Acidobacteria bacterium]|nr:response regulator [Acidobacteriota bacterium]
MSNSANKTSRLSPPVRITLIYSLAALGWILVSDRLLGGLVTAPDDRLLWQSLKGGVFVLLTALVLYTVTKRYLQRCEFSESRRREQEAQLQAIVRGFDGLIYVCSEDYRIEYMNDRLIQRTGHDARGEICYRVLHDRDDVCPWCVNERVFAGEKVEWEIQSPKDQRWYHVMNTPFVHADGRIAKQAMILDITERKKMESKLLESKRFESVADFAGEIAADFHTLLTSIMGRLSRIQLQGDHEDEEIRLLAEMEQDLIRAKDLTNQLGHFSRRRENDPMVHEIDHLAVAAAEVHPENGSVVRSERILLMDDEEIGRRVAARMLTRLGFRVNVAPTAAETLELCREAVRQARPFACVFLDREAETDGGAATIRQLQQMDPDIRIILVGVPESTTSPAARAGDGLSARLSKPYRINEFDRILAEVLTPS